MKKLVIYTCLTGSYDTLREPLAISPDADHICFSSSPTDNPVWQVKPLPRDLDDAALTSRWPKLNPHKLFPDYEYSLWIDANVVITGQRFYERLAELMEKGVRYAGLYHLQRDCIYDESISIIANSRDSLRNVMRTVRFLKANDYPMSYGLMENNVILRRHCDPTVVGFDELWWSLVRDYSHRDQLTQGFCRFKLLPDMGCILPKGENARNSDCLAYYPHSRTLLTDRSIRGRWNVYRADIKRLVYTVWLRLLLSRRS